MCIRDRYGITALIFVVVNVKYFRTMKDKKRDWMIETKWYLFTESLEQRGKNGKEQRHEKNYGVDTPQGTRTRDKLKWRGMHDVLKHIKQWIC